MFRELAPTDGKRWDISLIASFAVHALVVLILLHRSTPMLRDAIRRCLRDARIVWQRYLSGANRRRTIRCCAR